MLEPVARGGMAELWRGVHEATDTPVAVKVLSRDRVGIDPSQTRALHAEAAAMAGLRSRFVVQVYDFGVVDPGTARASGGKLVDGTPWIAMEWVGGGTLGDPGRVRSWPELLQVVLDVLGALAHAHARGIIHRDVKPENVLVTGTDPLRIKLADFGISFARSQWLEHRATKRPTGALTPKYAAPEQVRGTVSAQGPWTDLYLVGCLAWTLACGAPPFRRRRGAEPLMAAHLLAPAPALRPAFPVPPGLDGWVRRLMAKEPGDRFPCAADAEAALRSIDPAVGSVPRRRDVASSAPAPLLGSGTALLAMREPVFVARWAERDSCWQLLERVVADGRPRTLVIRGPSGVGTSALAGWLVERAEELGVGFGARGRDDDGVGVGSSGLAGLVGRWLGVSAARRTTGLEGAVRDALTTRPGPAPAVEPLVALLEHRSPDLATRFEIAAAALRWRADRPVILWVDVIHDEGELVAFARWLQATRLLPVLTVVSTSDERLADHPRSAGALAAMSPTTLLLAPLDAPTTLALIDGFGAVDGAMAARLVDRSAGNPRVVVELLRELARRRWSSPDPVDRGPDPAVALALPSTLVGLWEARLDAAVRSDPGQVPVLEVAATLGHRIVHEEWAEVCGVLGLGLGEQRVASLLQSLILRPDGAPGLYAFFQPTFREVVLGRLVGERRIAVNRACATVLEGRGADPARIGAHRQDAGEREAALSLLIDGASEAGFRGDWVHARIALDRAQTLLDPSDPRFATVLWMRIERARTAGATDEALHHVRHLLQVARSRGDPVAMHRALLQRAVIRGDSGDTEGAARDADEAVGIAEGIDVETHVTARAWQAMVLGVAGRTAEAMAKLRAIARVRPSEYLVHYGMGCLLVDSEEPAEALGWLDQMLEAVATRDDRLNEALARVMRAQALRMQGDERIAEPLAMQAESQLAKMRSGFVGEARVCLGLTRLALGRPADARGPLVRALVDAERTRRMAVLGLAVVAVRTGDDDPARWLAEFDPDGLWMSVAYERDAIALLASFADATSDGVLAERARAYAVRIDRRVAAR